MFGEARFSSCNEILWPIACQRRENTRVAPARLIINTLQNSYASKAFQAQIFTTMSTSHARTCRYASGSRTGNDIGMYYPSEFPRPSSPSAIAWNIDLIKVQYVARTKGTAAIGTSQGSQNYGGLSMSTSAQTQTNLI